MCSLHLTQSSGQLTLQSLGKNIHQLRDVIMEEWKRTPLATCEALVNSMPKRVKAVMENNGGHKIMTLWPQIGHFHLGMYSLLWPAV